jgi:hypothetical protein
MEIGSIFLVDLSQLDIRIFPKYRGLSFKVLKINQGKVDEENDEEVIDGMSGLNLHGSNG